MFDSSVNLSSTSFDVGELPLGGIGIVPEIRSSD